MYNNQVNNDDQNNYNINDRLQINQPQKKNKGFFIGIIIVLLVVILAIVVFYFNKISQEKNKKPEENYNSSNQEENDDNDEIRETEQEGYDGYSIEKAGNNYYLMRNGKEIAKLSKKDKIKLYKDESDTNSKYIAVVLWNNDFSLGQLWQTKEYAIGHSAILDKDKGYVGTSILYNINTGINNTFDGYVVPIIVNGKAYEDYFALNPNDDGPRSIVQVSDFRVLKNDYWIIGDSFPSDMTSALYSSSDKFMVAYKESKDIKKYGLVGYNGKVLIDFVYDDLVTIDNENILYAKQNGKFGAIDSTGKVIVNFEYDGIDYMNGNYAVLKGNKLGVLDKNGKVVVPFDIEVADADYWREFTIRLCCESVNSYVIEKNDDKELVIAYFDKNKRRKQDDKDYYEYKYSYLVVTKDGKYKTYDTYNEYEDDDWHS